MKTTLVVVQQTLTTVFSLFLLSVGDVASRQILDSQTVTLLVAKFVDSQTVTLLCRQIRGFPDGNVASRQILGPPDGNVASRQILDSQTGPRGLVGVPRYIATVWLSQAKPKKK